MFGVYLINAALALGQPGVGDPTTHAQRLPDGLPTQSVDGVVLPALGEAKPALRGEVVPTAYRKQDKDQPKPGVDDKSGDKKEDGKPTVIEAPLFNPAKPKPAEEAAAAEAKAEPDRWWLMRELQGTQYGKALDDHNIYLYGWVQQSLNATTASRNNLPLSWTDRANNYLMQQAWLRIGKNAVTESSDIGFGFQADFLYGSDYRFTLPRGLFNSQLQNANGDQNLYGLDPIQHYVSMYLPSIATEFRAGRLWTPWGVESLEAVSNPLITRSFAFNNSPPFTHCGVGAYTTYNSTWSSTLMVVNGNDVYFGDSSEEWRFVGALKWIQPETAKNTVTIAASVGRGSFNTGSPYFAATAALPNEPFGRNNLNAFDIVWTHVFNEKLVGNLELIYGYQHGVPIEAAPGLIGPDPGTARWFSAAAYLQYTLTEQVTLTTRLENFHDFQGQRTGFEGAYVTATTGVAYKPYKDVILRAEARYDHNVETRPYEGSPGLFGVFADLIVRF